LFIYSLSEFVELVKSLTTKINKGKKLLIGASPKGTPYLVRKREGASLIMMF